MANSTLKNKQAAQRHHYIRTIVSSFFGFIAVALIIVSILVVWLNRTLTNTDQYVNTVAPLVTNLDVQNFVVTKTSEAVLNNDGAPIRDISKQLLGEGPATAKTETELQTQITPIVKDAVRSVVTSPAFATLWRDSNTDIHRQLIIQLQSNADVILLDFHPVIMEVIDQLGSTKLAFIKDKLELDANIGQVTIKDKQLDTVHQVYDYFNKAMLAIIACAVLAFALCVVISVYHVKTMRRVALATGIFAAILAIVLSASSLVKVGGQDVEQQKMAIALVNGITSPLRVSLLVVAVICVAVVAGTKLYAWHRRSAALAKH